MFKNTNTTAKNNQYLWANLVTVLPSTPERIGRRTMIYKTVSNIKLALAVHQVQDVYICHQPYFKWILVCIYGHEDRIMLKTGKGLSYGGAIRKV